jgi:hypothetical protein
MKVDRRYSTIARSIWTHPKFLQLDGPKPNARDLVFRLLAAPEQTNVPGLYQAWLSGIAESLGWPLAATKTKMAAVENAGWIEADWKLGVIRIPGAIDQESNQPASPNVVRSWRQAFAEIPDCPVKDRALDELKAWAKAKGQAWAEALAEALGEKPPKPSPNPSGLSKPKPSPNQEQEQDQEQEQLAARSGPRPQEPLPPPVPGKLAGRLILAVREPGQAPKPRKDPECEALAFAKWGPSQQMLDWAREVSLSDEAFDGALADVRAKHGTKRYTIEKWDGIALGFLGSTLSRVRQSTTTRELIEGPGPASADAVAKRERAEQWLLDETNRKLGITAESA